MNAQPPETPIGLGYLLIGFYLFGCIGSLGCSGVTNEVTIHDKPTKADAVPLVPQQPFSDEQPAESGFESLIDPLLDEQHPAARFAESSGTSMTAQTMRETYSPQLAPSASNSPSPPDPVLAAAVDGPPASGLSITIKGAKSKEGVIVCSVFGNAADFSQRINPLWSERLPIGEGAVVYYFPSIEPGEYAVAAYHDKNENEKLDRHRLGFPTEAYGFSNNARGRLGPPNFQQVRFEVDQTPVSMEIRIK